MKKYTFVLATALCSVACLYAQHTSSQHNPKVYAVADAHLDTQWNWDIQTTIKDYVWHTLHQNLFLLEHFPHYVFNFEGGVKYAWMKEYYPDYYPEVKRFIKEGRWHVSGASWDANDVLVSSPESAIRNIMLGQNFYRKEFGIESTDIFLPDCFGFGWTLPTIASHCGLIGFSTQKLAWRKNPFYGKKKYPFNLGLWQGIDGSTLIMTHGFAYNHRWSEQDLSQNKDLKDLTADSPFHTIYHYYGTGDTGGSPTLESVRAVEQGIMGKGDVEIISSTSDQVYKDILSQNEMSGLPTYNGELLMDVHGTGCYTAQAAMKLYNRQNELLGDAAERTSVVSEWLNQAVYPREVLTENWKRFIFHQFHDDLTGTSIPRAYTFSWNDELIALKQFSSIITSSVNAVGKKMNTNVKGIPVIVYNALGFPVTDVVELEVNVDKPIGNVSVYDATGKKVSSQLVSCNHQKAKILVEATVPAVGYAVYDVRLSKGKLPTSVSTNDIRMLENSIYKMQLDEKGDIVSLFDKKNQKELVKPGKSIRLALFTENKSYTWPAWEISKETIDREPVSITDDVQISLVENGLLRKTLCVEKCYGKSRFKQYIRLYEGTRAERIDFYNEVEWQSSNALLKAEFPLNVSNSEATYDLGLGSIKRKNNTLTAYEVYAQYWADLTAQDGSYGVSVLNDCKYGWDKPNDHTLRLTLFHTPKTDKRYTYQDSQDYGHHCFTYSLIGHAGDLDKSGMVQKAEILNQKLKAFSTDKHQGELGKLFSFVSSDNRHVIIKALKKAENSDEYVVRVYETGGQHEQKATLAFAGEILKAYEADGTEKTLKPARTNKDQLFVDIKPYSVKTYKVRMKPSDYNSVPMEYAIISLPYNRKCSSFNALRKEANFESGYSYAAELWPDSLVTDQIPFKLGNKEIRNGMECNGDILFIPQKEKYNKLYFLAASAGQDCTELFECGGNKCELTVPSYTGFIGQWGWNGYSKGYLKDADIAYVGTHRHSPSGDEAYEFTYMFKFGIDIPEKATYIVLPKNRNIILFAATLVNEPERIRPASALFYTSIKENETEKTDTCPNNLLRKAKVIAYSGAFNDRETPKALIDGNLNSKWCEVNSQLSYVDFDLGNSYFVNKWKLVNAGNEGKGLITSDCILQGKNQLTDKWEPLDKVIGNQRNIIYRDLKSPLKVRYIRLVVTQPMQSLGGDILRINELEVYGDECQ